MVRTRSFIIMKEGARHGEFMVAGITIRLPSKMK